MPAETLVNLSKAASLLGVHPSTLRAWADRGEVASSRTAGGHRRFRISDLEAWQAGRQQGNLPGANLVVQSALGRARFELSGGRLDAEGWYSRLDGSTRQIHRQLGRRLLALLMAYLADPIPTSEALAAVRGLAREYEQLGRSSGTAMADTVRAFLFFRGYLHQSVFESLSASTITPETLKAWQTLHGRIEHFTNEALVALVAAVPEGG